MSLQANTPVFCDLSRGFFASARRSTDPSFDPFGQFFSRDALNLIIYPLAVNPDATRASDDPFALIPLDGLAVDAAIYDPNGTVLAEASEFTSDAPSNTFSGQLLCNTNEMVAYCTGLLMPVVIEFRFTGAFGSRNIRASTQVTKQFNFAGNPTALPLDQYPTFDEMLQLCIPRALGPGEGITFTNTNGQKFFVYVDNNGVLQHDPIS